MEQIPRILLAAPASGSGKTLITCGILQALIDRGKKVASFKCGPDYIDPMFHSCVIKTESRNLDPFFCGGSRIRYLLSKNTREKELAVLEGVMGYYDGLGGVTEKASTYEVAKLTKTPVILILNGKGMGASMIACLKGFLEYRKDSQIFGVILNQISPMIYPEMKEKIEKELSIRVYGYVSTQKDWKLESRHLGLVSPGEIPALQEKMYKFAQELEKTLDISGIIDLADSAKPLEIKAPVIPSLSSKVKIGIARDEAFSFYYADNLDLLTEMGAELVPFSLLEDSQPPHMDGLILGGGYPELYARQLSANHVMRLKIKEMLQRDMPCLAECGGFLYLQDWLKTGEGQDKRMRQESECYDMAGCIPAGGYPLGRLGRFGYITITSKVPCVFGKAPVSFPAHEFHYWESTDPGADFCAKKPLNGKKWDCIHVRKNLVAGFPHLYFYGNISATFEFVKACEKYKNNGEHCL